MAVVAVVVGGVVVAADVAVVAVVVVVVVAIPVVAIVASDGSGIAVAAVGVVVGADFANSVFASCADVIVVLLCFLCIHLCTTYLPVYMYIHMRRS